MIIQHNILYRDSKEESLTPEHDFRKLQSSWHPVHYFCICQGKLNLAGNCQLMKDKVNLFLMVLAEGRTLAWTVVEFPVLFSGVMTFKYIGMDRRTSVHHSFVCWHNQQCSIYLFLDWTLTFSDEGVSDQRNWANLTC